jgi:hypothetical protein
MGRQDRGSGSGVGSSLGGDQQRWRIDSAGLPGGVAQPLFEVWLAFLASQTIGGSQTSTAADGSRTMILGDPLGTRVEISVDDSAVSITRIAGVDRRQAHELIEEALARVAACDFGRTLAYKTTLRIGESDPKLVMGGHVMRILQDQVHIEGPRRLSGVALLDFEEGLLEHAPPQGLLFAPTSTAAATLFVSAPTDSDFSDQLASATLETVAAICALATGRTVTFDPLPLPLTGTEEAQALSRRLDPQILGLARDSVSLDIFDDLVQRGDSDALLRARGALLAYHAAMGQENPDVAVMLMITAIEALISPRATWGREKVTARFINGVIDLCADSVDALANHANSGQAFSFIKRGGISTQRKAILEQIYAARSLPTHTGLAPTPSGLLASSGPGSLRIALLSSLTREAILGYLRGPRSSIVGRPMDDAETPSAQARQEGLDRYRDPVVRLRVM